jgi:hypothetical protein
MVGAFSEKPQGWHRILRGPARIRALDQRLQSDGLLRVVKVAPGVLGPRHGRVKVDLVEPGHEPIEFLWTKIVTRQVFRDILQG